MNMSTLLNNFFYELDIAFRRHTSISSTPKFFDDTVFDDLFFDDMVIDDIVFRRVGRFPAIAMNHGA